MNISDFIENNSITFKQKFSDLWEELRRIEHDLWYSLREQEDYLDDDDLPKEEEDIHYLEGKREGFEEALAVFYNLENVEEIYEKEPER